MAAETISFARGAPSADILPREAVRDAAARALESDWQKALSYGTGIGHPGLCEWIATELHGIEAEHVMVTNGSMEAAALLFRYFIEPPDEIKTLAKRGSEHYISPNMLAESVVLELCKSGELERNIEFVNGALRERRDALVEALEEHIPEADFVKPEGGYFLWLTVGEDVDCSELLSAVKDEGVTFVAGCDFMLEGGGNALRLSFAPVPTDRISEGVQRIA